MARVILTMIIVLASFASTMPRDASAFRRTLKEGERISNGQYITVPDTSSLVPSWLAMQRDCNFVLYDQAGVAIWNSVTETQGIAGSCYATVKSCVIQIYDGSGDSASDLLWNSTNIGTGVAQPCYATILLSNVTSPPVPSVVLYDSVGKVQWISPPQKTSPSHIVE